MDILPRTNAFYQVSVRQTSALPEASFRHPLTSLPLPLANTSPYRVYRGLSPPSNCAMPGAPQKGHVVTNMPHIFLLFYILPTTQSRSFASATAKSMLNYL